MKLWTAYNRFTDSPVTHGEAWVTVVWESQQAAIDHAKALTAEYAITYPDMPQERRIWAVRPASVDEAIAAKEAGILGTEWADILGTGQAR